MGESDHRGVITPKEYLHKLCAYAMSLGMTYEQYWYGNYDLINYYIESEKIRQVKRNNEMWLQGLYVHIAIGDLVPVLNPFSKEHKAKKYLSKPIPITKEEQEEEERDKMQRFIKYMDTLVARGKK